MAWNKSDKRKFQSRYSDSHVTIAQYITEYLCEIVAKSCNQDLPREFWNIPEWGKFYKYQIMLANRLLNEYHPRALVRTLKDKRLAKLSSFAGLSKMKWMKSILVEYHAAAIAEDLAKKVEMTEKTTTTEKPVAIPSRPSLLGKLRGL